MLNQIVHMQAQRQHLAALSQYMQHGIRAKGFVCPSTSQIVPVVIGDSTATVSKAQQLQTAGFYVMPVRPPTVPKGSSRLRICLNTQFETEDLTPLLDLL